MAISVRLDPALEAAMEAEARRLGITNSALVKDSLVPRPKLHFLGFSIGILDWESGSLHGLSAWVPTTGKQSFKDMRPQADPGAETDNELNSYRPCWQSLGLQA